MTKGSKVHVSVHIRSDNRTSRIMADVLVALIPSAVAGVYFFGLRAALVLLVSVAAAVIAEWSYEMITGKDLTVSDFSAAVTGALLGLSLPSGIPIWQAVFGSVFAVVAVKCIFGGIGYNIANPAMCARVVMLLSFGEMVVYREAGMADTVSSATPLAVLSEGGDFSLWRLFVGDRGGCIGETCCAALLAGLAYLLFRRVVTWHIPLSFLASVFLLSFILESGNVSRALMWTISGSAVMGAVFFATDYVSSATTSVGKLIYGSLCGGLTVLIRLFGDYPEGVSFAVLFMNFTVPFIDIVTRKKVFGTSGKTVGRVKKRMESL